MIMASLVDAGVSPARLREELAKLSLPGWSLVVRGVMKGDFRATKVDVEIDGDAHRQHRSLRDILDILERSALEASVRERATRIFTRLADAEARVHGADRESVRFHDVGAVDAIVDVTGGVIALDLAGAQAVHVSALPVGGGHVRGPHGRIPVPAPGTVELLRGFPVVDTGVKAELVTPTGAAILTTLSASAGKMPAMTIDAIGYGAGTMDLPGTPNVLRCFLGQTAVIMKRGRPGVVVTALCAPERVGDLSRALFEETTTIGVRWSEWRRARLQREMVEVTTAYGTIPFKVSRLAGRIVTITPEFADVARIAREKSLPVREVLDQARADGRRLLGE
jgi:hypothetical protein